MTASYQRHGAVALITLNNPPINALGLATRRALVDGLDRAEHDDAVRAIVIAGAGKVFSGGADIKEFGKPEAIAAPNLWDLIARADRLSKPIVVAVHALCLGGGLELALGCHYRVAAGHATVALPEVKLGLVPGAGGTQRLPRAIGAAEALDMIVSGEPVDALQLARIPGQRLFDRIIEGDLTAAALTFAQEIAEFRPLPRLRDLACHHPEGAAYFDRSRAAIRATSPPSAAALRCVDAVEQATSSAFDDGLAYERELFMALMHGPESQALRASFFAERATRKKP